MGVLRKTVIASTGGVARVGGLRANSKKGRTANATEKLVKLQKQENKMVAKSVKRSKRSFVAGNPEAVPMVFTAVGACVVALLIVWVVLSIITSSILIGTLLTGGAVAALVYWRKHKKQQAV
jgi:Flp pilus assembly protein TadB